MSYKMLVEEAAQAEQIRLENTKEPYRVVMHRFEGRSAYGTHEYMICFNKSLVTTLNIDRMCDGMNYPRAKTWLGRVWNAIRNK